MTEQFPPLAVQNATLLRAIDAGPHPSPTRLAEAAGIIPNHIARKIGALEHEGLIVRQGDGNHQVALTDLGRRALTAIRAFDGEVTAPAAGEQLIPLDAIRLGPLNPRGDIQNANLEDLALSIADKGVLQPILVRPVHSAEVDYELVLGERRYRAARLGQERGWIAADFAIPARIRDLTDDDAFEIAGVENLQREDMHWMDEAEFYLALANKGRSASQIIRLVGEGGRKKRSIQELTQFARELDGVAKGRARLPEGDKDRLSIDQCRAIVGNKRERPALELTPKLAATLLEVIDCSMCAYYGGVGHYVASLHRKPTGGALTTLADRGLLSIQINKGRIEARVPITEDLQKWLSQTGFEAKPKYALRGALAEVVGDLRAAEFTRNGERLTAELNVPTTAYPPVHLDAGRDPDDLEPADDDGNYTVEDEHADNDGHTFEVGPSTGPQLEPLAALIVSEVAHKIAREGIDTEFSAFRGAPCRPDYSKDGVASALVSDRLLMFGSMRGVTIVGLTGMAREWLDNHGVDRNLKTNAYQISDEALMFMRLQMNLEPCLGEYWTEWLRPELSAEQVHTEIRAFIDADAAHAVRAPAPAITPHATDDTAPVTVPRRVITLLTHAAEQAAKTLRAAESRRLKEADTKPALALIAAAISDAESALKGSH